MAGHCSEAAWEVTARGLLGWAQLGGCWVGSDRTVDEATRPWWSGAFALWVDTAVGYGHRWLLGGPVLAPGGVFGVRVFVVAVGRVP